MTWTPDTWGGFCALVANSWGGDFDDAARDAWRVLLDPVDPEAAGAALLRLAHSGRKFYPRPAVSDLLAELRADPSTPTFEEAYRLIFGSRGALHARPDCRVFADTTMMRAAQHDAILDRARGMHPLIGTFIERMGIDRLMGLELEDPDWGEKRRRDLREAWDRHVEACDGRAVAAIASGGRTELRQLDPLSALGVARPALPGGRQPSTEGAR